MKFSQLTALSIWMGLFHANLVILLVEVYFLPHPGAFACLFTHILLGFWPPISFPRWGESLAGWVVTIAHDYFPLTMQCEDDRAFKADQPYIIGLEPHAVLPVSICGFAEGGHILPAELNKKGRKIGHSSGAIFHVPLVRHLWSWLGLRPVSRNEMSKHLKKNRACILVPGGVQEIMYLDKEVETIFLRKRTGFVKLALQHGAPLVPAFAFGLHKTYSWASLLPQSVMLKLSRFMGFAPLVFWGVCGGPLPKKHPIHIVLGKPIEVPTVAEPSPEEVQKYLDAFIAAMEDIFDKHKEKMPDCPQKLKIL